MRGGRLDVTDGANRTFGGFGGAERVSLRQAHDRHPPERGGGAIWKIQREGGATSALAGEPNIPRVSQTYRAVSQTSYRALALRVGEDASLSRLL